MALWNLNSVRQYYYIQYIEAQELLLHLYIHCNMKFFKKI